MKKNWIKTFDLLHIPMSLSYKNEYLYKTNIGAVLTIICFIFIISITAFEIRSLVDKTSFSLITSQYMDLSEYIDFSQSILLFQLVDSSGKEIDNSEKIYEFRAYDMESVSEYTSSGKKYSKAISKELELDYCDNILLNDIDYFSELNLSKYLCIKPGQNITSYGFLGDMSNGYKGIRIYLNKCNNKTDCHDEDTIKNELQNSRFRVAYISLNTNIFNMGSKNLSFQIFSKSCSISTNLLKKFHFSFSIGRFHLYNDIFFKKEIIYDYIIGHEPNMDVDLDPSSTLKNNNNTLAYFSFNYDGNIIEISKEVKRFFDVFSIVGNSFNIILTIFKIINSYYSNKILFVDIFKNIFFCKDKPNGNFNNKFNFPRNINNNENLNNSNIQNNSKKNVMDLSEGLILNNNNKNNSIQKKSSYNKMIITSDKSKPRIVKRGSYVYTITKEDKKRLIYFYLFPLCILKKHKLFNNLYMINDRICNYFSIEKINELIKFKEAFSHKSNKMKINNTEFIKVDKKFQDIDSIDFQLNKQN
jgi:hypothetical protein